MTRLVDAELLLEDNSWEWFDEWGNYTSAGQAIADAPTVDAVEVVHGEWIYWRDNDGLKRCKCSECLTSYGCLDTPYCPNCGADMREGRWKGEGMGDFSCSLCGEIVSGNHREKCPNCHAKMDGGEKE